MVTVAEVISIEVIMEVVVGCVVPACVLDPDVLSCVASVGFID